VLVLQSWLTSAFFFSLRSALSLPRARAPDVSSLGIRDFEVRGELVMSKEEFASLNAIQREAGEREYSNPRNLVAGVLNRY
jgi:DNA ligase (NAD+)